MLLYLYKFAWLFRYMVLVAKLRSAEVEFSSSLSWVPPTISSPQIFTLFVLVVLLVLLSCFGAISLTENNKQSCLYILILHKVCVCQITHLPLSQMAVWCEDILSFMSLPLIKAKQGDKLDLQLKPYAAVLYWLNLGSAHSMLQQ